MDPSSGLSSRVRDLVRERRIDPRADVDEVRRLAVDAVADHERRSLSGVVRPLEEPERVVGEIVADVSGFGVLQPYLEDDAVEEIWINAPDRVFVARGGVHELTTTVLTTEAVRELVERMLQSSGRRLDVSQPFVDAMLPGGHRLHVVLDGITRGFSAVNVRKFVARAASLDDLVALDSLDSHAAQFLSASVRAGLNIVVSGGTQAGKTTLLNCLAAAIPGTERVISAEEVFELRFTHPDWVPMQTRQAGLEGTGEVDLRALVKEALRMRPTRLMIGEVRGAECLDLLLALNSGLPSMASIHASSARQALAKLCALPLLAGENIGASFVVPTVATAVDLVVHARLDADGRRCVDEVLTVTGRVENGNIETEPVFRRVDGVLARSHGIPSRREDFERIGVDVVGLLDASRPRRMTSWAP